MLSRQDLANLAGTSPFTIRRIERGEGSVRPQTGRAVARALGVDPEELLPKAQAPLPFEESTPASQAAAGRTDMERWAKVRTLILADELDADGILDASRELMLEMFPELRHRDEALVEAAVKAFAQFGGPQRANPELRSALESPAPETTAADIGRLAAIFHEALEESAAQSLRLNPEMVGDVGSGVGAVGEEGNIVGTVGSDETPSEALHIRSAD
jgi:transcriptional regulator with XRE-family HTH domain